MTSAYRSCFGSPALRTAVAFLCGASIMLECGLLAQVGGTAGGTVTATQEPHNKGEARPLGVAALKTSLGGFLDVPWGTSQDQAKHVLLKRAGIEFDTENSTEDGLYFSDGTFSDRPLRLLKLSFIKGQFYEAYILLDAPKSSKVIWEDIVVGLKKQYGEDNAFVRGEMATFSLPGYPEPTLDVITCGINRDRDAVFLIYKNSELENVAEKVHKEGVKTNDL